MGGSKDELEKTTKFCQFFFSRPLFNLFLVINAILQ